MERQRLKIFKNELLRDDIHWYWLRYHKFPVILSSIYDMLVGVFVSGGLVIRKKIKFIHARSYVPASIAFVLSKILKIRYIFDMRGFMIDDYAALGIISKNNFIQRLSKRIEKAILKNSHYIIVLTQKARQVISDFFQSTNTNFENIETIPCCVDTARFSHYVNKDPILLTKLGLENKFVIIYVGSMGRLYQFDKMLDFFKVAYNSIPNAYFLIITPDIKQVVSESLRYKDTGLFKHISYLKIDPEEIGRYISLGDVGIAFYLPSPSRVGTSPTKIGEYLACGIPFVINAGVGDTEKWINQYKIGAVVEDFNAKNYKEAINTVLNLIKDRDYIGKRCREVANELLSLEIARGKYLRIYSSLISSNNN